MTAFTLRRPASLARFIACTAIPGLALSLGACHDSQPVTLAAPRAVSAPTAVGTAPMFAVAPSGAEAIAWISAPDSGADGRLYVSVNGRAPVEMRDTLGAIAAHGEAPPQMAYGPDGALNALYVVGKEVPGARFPRSALRFVRSVDGGAHWSAPVTVTDDSVFGSHNFHALHAAADGTLYAAWLDGRTGKSAVYVTHSTDGGRTWAPNQRVSLGEACPCCRTAIATASDGTVYLAWRMVYPGSVRDIVVAHSTDHGATWSEPVRVHDDHWVFDACPHAGPSLRVDASGAVHIAWWTGKEGAAGVYYARSDDHGATFSTPVPLGIAQYSRPAHVQLALGPERSVLAAWDDGTKQVPEVVLRVSRDGGRTFAPPQVVSADGRAATFPVLAISDSGSATAVAIAWSEESADAATQAAKARPNMKDPHATMGLERVGEAQVLVREGRLQ
jgi:hypothetical protein